MTGDEVRDTWLLDAGSLWAEGVRTGYPVSEVDDLLRRVAAELDAGRPAGPLIEDTTFRARSGRKGYDIDAVDWFLEQILRPPDHLEPGEASADPWRDVGDVTQLVLGGVSGLAQRHPSSQKPTRREASVWFADQCENAWRDFGKQPGVQLWGGQVEQARWELRTAGQQTLADLQGGGLIHSMIWGRGPLIAALRRRVPKTVRAGGRRFTFQKMNPARSSSPVIAEIAARAARDAGGHFAKRPGAGPRRVRGLVDEAGTPILYISGENFGWRARLCVSFPDGRWLRFPVRGTKAENAIMTAVDQVGDKVARYRMRGEGFEITVNPDQQLTDDLILAIAITATGQFKRYFAVPG